MGLVSAALLDDILKFPSAVFPSDSAPERQKATNPEEIP